MTSTLNIAFLTGPSDLNNCALSPVQTQFLRKLSGANRRLIETNFPYGRAKPHRELTIARASLNNVYTYFVSRRISFARRHRPSVEALLESAEHTLFLTGSCGLELFNNLRLERASEERCTLLCYGPVARRAPLFARSILVQSERDLISRAAFRASPRRLSCGHMAYLSDSTFLRVCQDEITSLATLPCFSTSDSRLVARTAEPSH